MDQETSTATITPRIKTGQLIKLSKSKKKKKAELSNNADVWLIRMYVFAFIPVHVEQR